MGLVFPRTAGGTSRCQLWGGWGNPRRLPDEIDIIPSVSGGSFTVAAYGLCGDKAFEVFEPAFLKRNVQGALLWIWQAGSRRHSLNTVFLFQSGGLTAWVPIVFIDTGDSTR